MRLNEALRKITENEETSLVIADNDLFDAEVVKLANALFSNTALTSFHLTCAELPHNGVGDSRIEFITKALSNNTSLQSLQLDHCDLSAEGAEQVAALLSNNTTLTTFNIDENNIAEQGIRRLCNSLENNLKLTTLACAGNEIGYAGAKHLASLLKLNKCVTDLDCSSNDIGDDGLQAICHVMKQNNTLTHLNISSNNIGGIGLTALADMLTFNTRLTSLDCCDNTVGDGGTDVIATALRDNKTLVRMKLSSKIGDTGAISFAHMLNYNNTLLEVDLTPSIITEEGAKALLSALRTNKTLESFQVYLEAEGKEERQNAFNKLCARNVSDKKTKKERTKITADQLAARIDWSPELVGVWLGKRGFDNQVATFEKNRIDGLALFQQNLDTLRTIGIGSYAIRRDLMDVIDRLRDNLTRTLREEWGETDDDVYVDSLEVYYTTKSTTTPQLTPAQQPEEKKELDHMQKLQIEREKTKRSTPLHKYLAEAESLDKQELEAIQHPSPCNSHNSNSPRKHKPLTGNLSQLPIPEDIKDIIPDSVLEKYTTATATPSKNHNTSRSTISSPLSASRSPRLLGSLEMPLSPTKELNMTQISTFTWLEEGGTPSKAFYAAALADQTRTEKQTFQHSKKYEQAISPFPARYN